MTKEIQSRPLPGLTGLVLFLALLALAVFAVVPTSPVGPFGFRIALIVVGFVAAALMLNGFFIVQPNQAEVLVLLGN
jgi:uncharacterized membrane protein